MFHHPNEREIQLEKKCSSMGCFMASNMLNFTMLSSNFMERVLALASNFMERILALASNLVLAVFKNGMPKMIGALVDFVFPSISRM